MLDTTTKRKINDARDILVGKVPVPSSQVEQITIALIYKFMYDMDNESIELGGNPKYFTGDFAQYAWNKLFDPKLSGEGRIQLYQDALAKIPNNAEIPSLFRDIFKNAFLPYRDPETLKLFLKCIDEFTYDHSERLGDAFEYLLAVLGSQGDAGQFRTPRHIIDFMVKLIDPQKEDSILDPACGTAGFLISAYKHILKVNSSNYDKNNDPHSFAAHDTPLEELVINGRKYPGDLLTPDQRAFLHQNIKGYDIAFEMVRLSLVNMYLHGFNTPQIYEYDTLTSTERWNEYANVILANPPFMTPKGGIRPHQKFTIQAKRSEVLFVDYMLEHLTNNGKAGIIVPEGIIFQNGKAYKQLRKLLVEENYLVGVISLPSGVFNPYSGVKTSILWIDKVLARKTDKIIFLKVNNDGFDLGAQRRPIDANDLPMAFSTSQDFKDSIMSNRIFSKTNARTIIINKKAILSDKYCSLFVEKYLSSTDTIGSYPMSKLGDVISESSARIKNNIVDVWSVSNELGFVKSSEYFDKEVASKDISNYKMVHKHYFAYNPSRINVGSIAYNRTNNIGAVSPMYTVFYVDDHQIVGEYLLQILKSKWMNAEIVRLAHGSIRKQLRFNDLSLISVPLPPTGFQEEIVAELDSYQKIIDGARQVVDNWESRIDIDPKWDMIKLGDVCKVKAHLTKTPNQDDVYVGADSIEANTGLLLKMETVKEQSIRGPVYQFDGKKLLYSKLRPYLNKLCITEFSGCCSSDMYPLEFDSSVIMEFAKFYILSDSFLTLIEDFQRRARMPKLNREQLFSVPFPLPDLSTQQAIIERIENEQNLVNANRELIALYEQKIQNKIDTLWKQE